LSFIDKPLRERRGSNHGYAIDSSLTTITTCDTCKVQLNVKSCYNFHVYKDHYGALAMIRSITPVIAGMILFASAAGFSSGMTLTVTMSGDGSGTITSVPAGIVCISGTCNHDFPTDEMVSLLATPSVGSLFSNWSGGCSGSSACSLKMDASKAVTAAFTSPLPARIGQTLYPNVQAAYNAAQSGSIILLKEGVQPGPLNADAGKTVAIKGGYDPTYTVADDSSVIQGGVFFRQGKVLLDKVKVRPISDPPVPDLVRTRLNVEYATSSAKQKLDLYLPPTGNGPFPVVIWIHGGGWWGGDKYLSSEAPQLGLLASGYALASVNYRFSTEARFPAQIYDVKAAVRFLRSNATVYGIDKDHVAVWGSSAGGHLAALAGTSGGVAALEDLAQGNSAESSLVQAVIDWFGPIDFQQLDPQAAADGCAPYGGTGFDSPSSPVTALLGATITERPDLVRAANPITYISADDPPFFIQHGTQDCNVSRQQSQLLYDALAPVIGSDMVMLQFLAAGHGGSLFDEPANISRIVDFLSLHFNRAFKKI